MRHLDKVDIAAVKELMVGLFHFAPVVPEGISPLFYGHLFLVSVLLAYFPFSKLTHMAGRVPEPHPEHGQQQPGGASREPVGLPGEGPHLRGIRGRAEREDGRSRHPGGQAAGEGIEPCRNSTNRITTSRKSCCR